MGLLLAGLASVAPAQTAPDAPLPPAGLDAARILARPTDLTRLLDDLRAYPARYPDRVRLVQLGTSREGRPILALALSRDVARSGHKPTALLDGAHHGGELLSIALVLDAIDRLLGDPRHGRLLDELVVWCVPMVNPDGVWAALAGAPRTSRKNGRDNNRDGRVDAGDGVDLNRNYPFRWGALGERGSSARAASYWYRGPSPGSEPETQAVMRLAEAERPLAAISFHTGNTAVLAPYTIEGVRDPVANEALVIAAEVTAALQQGPLGGAFLLRRQLYPVDGTAQDFLRARYGTVGLLIEAARRTPATEAGREAALAAIRPGWAHLLNRYLDGPSLWGQVRDGRGRPVAAEVTVAELAPREGETWTARPRDGRFDRYLPGPGRYTLRVRASGHRPLTRTVDVPAGRAHIDIILP